MTDECVPAAYIHLEREKEQKYKGILMIGGRTFHCKINCSVPFPEFDPLSRDPFIEERIRSCFSISLQREPDGDPIPLSDFEYDIFYRVVIALIHPEISSSEGVNYEKADELIIDQKTLDLLRSSKFGCSF